MLTEPNIYGVKDESIPLDPEGLSAFAELVDFLMGGEGARLAAKGSVGG